MSGRMPKVPPGSRSTKGPGGSGRQDPDQGAKADNVDERQEPEKTGQTANTHVNTTNQGHQQDR